MQPLVSIVIPTFQRPQLLERCLAAVLAQDLERNAFEVIVADDAADAATRRQVECLGARYVAVRGRHGPAAARNRGWQAAHAPVIAFTDDDCIPNPDWLRQGLAALRGDAELAAVAGGIHVPLREFPTDYERDAARLEQAGFVTANCFCRRWALEVLRGFDEDFTLPWREDSDLYFTLLERGYRIGNASAARVAHPVRAGTWGESLRQQRKVQFDALLYKKHPQLYRTHIRPTPPWRYYGTTASLAAATASAAAGSAGAAAAATLLWGMLTLKFCGDRLSRTSRRMEHVVEMLVTSALIPPLAVFWRLAGAWRFRVAFL